MKKLFLLLLMSASIMLGAKAQFGSAAVFPLVAGDTLNNVDSVAKIITASAGYKDLGIQVNLNKLSGTVGGKVYLYASMDKRNYTLIDSASYNAIPVGGSGSIFGVSNGYTHVAIISRTGTPFTNYLVVPTSSGTVSAPIQVSYTLRKYITQ